MIFACQSIHFFVRALIQYSQYVAFQITITQIIERHLDLYPVVLSIYSRSGCKRGGFLFIFIKGYVDMFETPVLEPPSSIIHIDIFTLFMPHVGKTVTHIRAMVNEVLQVSVSEMPSSAMVA